MISVVVPGYNEADSIAELVDRLEHAFTSLLPQPCSFEVIYVDDGSKDGSQDVLRKLVGEKTFLRAVFLRTNNGKSMALTAGFSKARGDYIVTMDADLQDNPEDIPKMLEKLDEGYDFVSGYRASRNDTSFRRLGSRFFNYTACRVGGLDLHDLNCGFKAFRSEILDTIVVYGQYHRYVPLLAHFAGFRVTETAVTNSPRKHGTSKYKAFRYEGLIDLLSIFFIHKYSLSPFYLFAVASFLFILPSMAILMYLGAQYAFYVAGASEYTSLINRPILSLSLTMFTTGVSIFLTGFVCDFILHHLIQARVGQISEMSIKETLDND